MSKPVPGHVKYMCAATLLGMICIGNQLYNGNTNATLVWSLATIGAFSKGLRELHREGSLHLAGLKQGLFAISRRIGVTSLVNHVSSSMTFPKK